MKAILCPAYGPPEVLKIGQIPNPDPKIGQVKIRIKATTVSVADVRLRAFRVPGAVWLPARLALGIFKPRKPVLGMEYAGEVVAVGPGVRRFQVGDEVLGSSLKGFGAYAEYLCQPESGPIVHKPSDLSFEEAAALPIGACTALHYLQKAGIQAGQKVLIYGASGSVGSYAVQLARHFGAEVTAVCSATNHDWVQELGADHLIDYRQPGWEQQLARYDLFFVAVDKVPFRTAWNALTERGVYANITRPFRSWEMMRRAFRSKKRLLLGESFPNTPEGLSFLSQLVEKGQVQAVIDRAYDFEEVVEAHRYVDQGHKKGNVVLLATGEEG